MPQPTSNQRPPGLLMAIWFSFIGFIGSLFHKSPSAATLPNPVTARSPKGKPSTSARTTPAPVHQRISIPYTPWVMEPTPLKHPPSAAGSPIPSTARTTPVSRSRSTTPRRATDPEHLLHPPPSPFPNISLSGIFATPPLLSSPRLVSDVEFGCLSLASPSEVRPLTLIASSGSPSPFQGSHGSTTPSFHTLYSRPPCTPGTPSSAVIVRLDRSPNSPTMMSDGSLEVISLGDRRAFAGSPVNAADVWRLPSPWSPIGRMTSLDVWMSVEGILVDASGPVDDNPVRPQDDSVAPTTALFSSLTLQRISASSSCSSSSAFDALGITAFVNLDGVGDHLSGEGNGNDPVSIFKLNQVRDGNPPTLVCQEPQTPRKRRQTVPSVTGPHSPSKSSRATKCLSTPLTKLDNINISHIQSASSISSMAYELRLFAEGKSMATIGNIISLLDQTSPESIPPRTDPTRFVETI